MPKVKNKLTGLALVKEIKKAIEDEPERFYMANWVTGDPECGTTMCIAGWACVLNGAQIQPTNEGDLGLFLPNGERISPGDWAQDLLYGEYSHDHNPFYAPDEYARAWIDDCIESGYVLEFDWDKYEARAGWCA
jgi:hypothetical protein